MAWWLGSYLFENLNSSLIIFLISRVSVAVFFISPSNCFFKVWPALDGGHWFSSVAVPAFHHLVAFCAWLSSPVLFLFGFWGLLHGQFLLWQMFRRWWLHWTVIILHLPILLFFSVSLCSQSYRSLNLLCRCSVWLRTCCRPL